MVDLISISKGLVSGVKTLLTGQVGKRIEGILDRIVPEKLSEAEKAQIRMEISEIEHEQQMEVLSMIQSETAEFNQRIKDLEGTAKDLSQFGFFGRVIIFLRGVQRPLFGFGVFIWDWFYFSEPADFTSEQSKLLFVVNLLVLGFLFGERAVKNVAPIIGTVLAGKK